MKNKRENSCTHRGQRTPRKRARVPTFDAALAVRPVAGVLDHRAVAALADLPALAVAGRFCDADACVWKYSDTTLVLQVASIWCGLSGV